MEPVTWVEVSRTALEANFRSVSNYAGVPVCAVVKANAYGHGLVEAARVFSAAGAPILGVTRLEEAAALRDAGIDAPILLLMPTLDPIAATALDCEITVGSWSEIEALPSAARVHLKIDTGMGRLGFDFGEAPRAASDVFGRAKLAAVWTHLGDSGRRGRIQLSRFLSLRDQIRSAGIECRFHAANSSAMLSLPESRLDMVRVGTLLYGENPGDSRAPFPLRDPFTWYARVVAVREVRPGTTVGYGGEWRAPRRLRIATLPVGYRDGVSLHPLIRTETLMEATRLGAIVAAVALKLRPTFRYVLFGESRAPVVGRIGMQQMTVSLDGLDDVSVGSIARIPARRLLVSSDIPRVYI